MPLDLDQGTNLLISLRVGGTLAENDQGTLGASEDLESTFHSRRSR